MTCSAMSRASLTRSVSLCFPDMKAAAAPDQHHGNPFHVPRLAVLFSLGTVTGPHSADTIKDVPFIIDHLRVVEFQWRMSAVGEVHDEGGRRA